MLKQISIIFSLLLVIASSESVLESKYLVKAQTDSILVGQNTTENTQTSTVPTNIEQPEKVFIPIENLVISKTSQGLVELSASVRNNQTFNIHDIKIQGEFFDKDGASLGKIDEFVTQPSFILKPDASHNFVSLEVISHYKLASSNFTASGESLQ